MLFYSLLSAGFYTEVISSGLVKYSFVFGFTEPNIIGHCFLQIALSLKMKGGAE